MVRWVVVVWLVSACGRFGFGELDAGDGGDATADAPSGTMRVSFGERAGAQHSGVTTDTSLRASQPTANYGGDDNVTTSATDTALVRFDVTAIAPGTSVLAAELHVATEDTGLASGSVQIYEVLEAWTEGSSQGAAGVASYNERVAATSWTNAGCGAPGSRAPALLAQFAPASRSTDYTVPLSAAGVAAVQRWVDSPASNHGFALVVSPGGSNVSFISREGGATAAPLLVITVP